MKKSREEFIELVQTGSTREEIMEHFGWSQTYFHVCFRDCFPGKSIKQYSKKVDHKYFANLNSGNKCYLLGFLLADGCISSQQKSGKLSCFQVAVKREDEIILELFKKEISSELTLQRYENANGYQVSKIQWTSENMANDLLQYVSSLKRKSYDDQLDLYTDKIPDHYFGDFIRGLIDGDGTIKLAFPKIEILFSSELFATKVQEKLQRLVPGVGTYIKKDTHYSKVDNEERKNSLYRLFISSANQVGGDIDPFFQMKILYYTEVFYYFLYNNSEFYLPRKKERFIKYKEGLKNQPRW